MNLLLIEPDDIFVTGYARIVGRRFEHLRDVLKAKVGSEMRAGVVDGLCGTATLRSMTSDSCELEFCCTQPAPAKLPLTLIVALPRPQTFKKILEQATSMGVADFVFIKTARVEKSFLEFSRTFAR
jgi:RsmE family RNA methyltransferase